MIRTYLAGHSNKLLVFSAASGCYQFIATMMYEEVNSHGSGSCG
jgi:hypothetical protein